MSKVLEVSDYELLYCAGGNVCVSFPGVVCIDRPFSGPERFSYFSRLLQSFRYASQRRLDQTDRLTLAAGYMYYLFIARLGRPGNQTHIPMYLDAWQVSAKKYVT